MMKRLALILLPWLYVTVLKAQVMITNVSVQPFDVTPEGLLRASILNNESEMDVQLQAEVLSAGNVSLITVRSQLFHLVKGLNPGVAANRRVASVSYGTGGQADYLKSTHTLPSGRYKVCVSLLPLNGADRLDNLCDEIEAEYNQYIYLVSPFDGDTIDTKNPLLMWTHSEPFSILGQGEYYRMIVSEIKKDQTTEDAIAINAPVMVKSYLNEHQYLYPYDARELKAGTAYAWQVQKISDGIVVNKTEAWRFVLRPVRSDKSLRYVALKEKPDGDYYTAVNGKVYFKFSEEYMGHGRLDFSLQDAKHNPIAIDILKDNAGKDLKSGDAPVKLKIKGNNYYDLDLNGQNLNTGYYTLRVMNEKNEVYYLKIMLP